MRLERPADANTHYGRPCQNRYSRYQAPTPLVEYDSEGQILRVETGQSSQVGEEIAEDVIVHYDKNDDHAPASAVAIRIDRAEQVLKPFVDAILAKYGVKPVQYSATNETSD